MKSHWFKRLQEECKSLSPHLRFKRIRNGFYRIYIDDHYIAECFEDMPEMGYQFEAYDDRFEDQRFYEEYMDDGDPQRLIKNFVEGYWETIRKLQVRVYMMKHDQEFNETARRGYKQLYVK